MTDRTRLHQLQTFLYLLAASLFAGTVVELLVVEHYDDPVQLIPFALCGLGILAIGLVWRKPTRPVVLAFRTLMVVTALGSLLGVYKHLEGNYEFAHELHPRASFSSLIGPMVKGGAPLLAPGVLAIGATIGVAATFATVAMGLETVPEMERRTSAREPLGVYSNSQIRGVRQQSLQD